MLTLLISSLSYCQNKHELKIGLNVSYFNDWKDLKYGLFNPELSYARAVSDKYGLSYTLNAFYADNLSRAVMKDGGVVYRLIFSNDVTFDYLLKNFSYSIGPSIRYRNEKQIKYFYPQPEPFEFVIEPKKSHIDYGAAFKIGYNLKLAKKSFVSLKLAYRLYNKGVNPISVGASYGLCWN